MTARRGWLERLLGWAAGATSDERTRRAVPDDPASEQAADERERRERREAERELDLRMLMTTWM